MSVKKYDTIIIGAGLVGLSVAYHLKRQNPDAKVLVIEKEKDVAKHQSGNNSGVMHSGIYYAPGSLKAKNCIAGYNSLITFAEEHSIPYELCGKVIVATSPEEVAKLNDIYDRGIRNGLKNLRKLSSQEEIQEIEPHCAGIKGIHVPQTGIIDYPKMAAALLNLYQNKYGGEVAFGEKVINIHSQVSSVLVETEKHTYLADNMVSCAGLFSDRVANMTEKENDLRIIPFRGEYYKLSKEKEHLVKTLIYPVPDPSFPFLGVHFTRMIRGGVEAGPNAVLAFKREGYKFQDFSLKDTQDTFTWPGFWKIAAKYGQTGLGEMYRSLSKAAFTKALQKLVPEVQESDLVPGGAGVRAQACDRKGKLIDDFDILKSRNIIHVRNAPSPAATSSLAIGKYICSQLVGGEAAVNG
ncbi:L-2-hydroxyglutarate oxidase [Pontibacter ummariensis]|uniref:L-2-hydroxyglutarate oxidase n=1 Tax=Pontibacter ummariensis TaxID=1610492 RepID=A0A239CPL7_9BACT|nr:L-2-hydroxyglutarate oxidase [Pontibacter ummariensis]PRY14905.1 L-2-hydroxyglutarate oxidase [Pontibacter ummariensis]SNS21889.1 L-2-hydroxyglutarate oxidase [Pontibacter ummariensis]